MTNITIDPGLQSLIPPLTEEEKGKLRVSLIRYGCREPIILWNGVIVDGHNRYEICTANKITFKTREMHFNDKRDAEDWIIEEQLGRRNLTEEQKSYLRGLRFNREKAGHGGARSRDQNDTLKTRQRLAAEHKVGEATISRDAKYAKAIDAIAEHAGPEARTAILQRDSGLTKQEVASLAQADEETQVAVISSAEERAEWKRQELAKRKADKDFVRKAQDDLIRGDMAEEFAAFLLERIREDDIPQFISYSDAVPTKEMHKAIRRLMQERRTGQVVPFTAS